MCEYECVCVCIFCVGGWVTAGALSSVFSIINPSEDSQKGVSSVPDARPLVLSHSLSHTHTQAETHMDQTHPNLHQT